MSAGADYNQIQLSVEGADKIIINNKGELVLKTPLGEITEQAPLVTQNGKILKSNWHIKNNLVTFEIDNSDPHQPLIIDPALRVWGNVLRWSWN